MEEGGLVWLNYFLFQSIFGYSSRWLERQAGWCSSLDMEPDCRGLISYKDTLQNLYNNFFILSLSETRVF